MNDLDEINIDNLPYSEASKYFDPSSFSIDPFVEVTPTEWGEKAVFTPQGLPYMGSELRFGVDKDTGEQVSDRFRIFIFRDGQATIYMEEPDGQIIEKQMGVWLGYRIHKGQKYRIHSHTNSRILEAAMPEAYDGPVHKDHFHFEEYVLRIGKPWGYELHFAKEDDPLMAKILHVNGGDRLSQHAHRAMRENYWMLNGECAMEVENSGREMSTFTLQYDKGYSINVGQRHRHIANSETDVFEVAVPEHGKTWRVQDDYERPDETDQVRKIERGEL